MKDQVRLIAIGATLRRARSQINMSSKSLLLVLLSLGAVLNIFMRMPTRFEVSDLTLDTSWFMELENQLRQGHLLGRDVHFTYGPLAQVLVWLGSLVRTNDSALYGLALGNAFFEVVAVVALALTLAMIKQIRGRGTLFIFVMYVVLNSVLFLRPLIVLLSTVLLVRTIEAPLQRRRFMSVLVGLLWFAGQLITVELVVYSILSAAALLGLCTVLALGSQRRLKLPFQLLPAWAYIEVMLISLGTCVLCNAGIEIFYRLSSATYIGFDYIYFSLLLIRNYSYTMGSDWTLNIIVGYFLLSALIYTVFIIAVRIRSAKIEEFYLLLGLLITSIVNSKSAFVRSDAIHIFQAIGPFIFLFLLVVYLIQEEKLLKYTGYVLLMLITAISTRYSAQVSVYLKNPISQGVDLAAQWQGLLDTEVDPRSIVPKEFEDAIDPQKKLLNFPYDNVIAIALNQPSLAPILQTYAAFNEDMQKRYVQEVDRYRDSTEIVYGLDRLVSYQIGNVQSITRTPLIFKYILENFKLKTNQVFREGYLVLTARQTPARVLTTALPYDTQTDGTVTTMVLRQPATCGLLQMDVALHYPLTAMLGRPNPLTLLIYHGEKLLAENDVVAIENGRTFSTFFYIGSPERFGELFGDAPRADLNVTFDRISISPGHHDLLGVNPDQMAINNLRCVQHAPY